MKKIYFLLLACPLALNAQNKEGKITYEERVQFKMDLKLDGVENADQIRAMMPKSHTSKKILLFNSSSSLYKNLEANNVENNIGDNGDNVQIKMVMSTPDEEFFRDFENGKVIEKHDLFGKAFIVEGGEKASWKITKEQKSILGYPCTKAILSDTSKHTEAWFTTTIPVSSGPGPFADLPGMVLLIDKDKGQTVIEATLINLAALTEKLEIPAKGKKVSREEYMKIVERKNKEMQENGGSRVIIRHSN